MDNKPLLIANWKMQGDCALVKRFIQDLKPANNLILCLPQLLLAYFQSQTESAYLYGAQDCSSLHADKGAYTGEISARMLAEFQVKYCLVGHSERRQYCQENATILQRKFINLLMHEIQPILCIGEDLATLEAGEHISMLQTQITAILENLEHRPKTLYIAYEPIWAIGSGKVPTYAQITQAYNVIEAQLRALNYHDYSILYGGSVKASNAMQILQNTPMSGLLIGGASLDPEALEQIIQQVNI